MSVREIQILGEAIRGAESDGDQQFYGPNLFWQRVSQHAEMRMADAAVVRGPEAVQADRDFYLFTSTAELLGVVHLPGIAHPADEPALRRSEGLMAEVALNTRIADRLFDDYGRTYLMQRIRGAVEAVEQHERQRRAMTN